MVLIGKEIDTSIFSHIKTPHLFSPWILYDFDRLIPRDIVIDRPIFSYEDEFFVFFYYTERADIYWIKRYQRYHICQIYRLNIIDFFFHHGNTTQEILCIEHMNLIFPEFKQYLLSLTYLAIEEGRIVCEFLTIVNEYFCFYEFVFVIGGRIVYDREDTRYQRIGKCEKYDYSKPEKYVLIFLVLKGGEFLYKSFGSFPHFLAADILDEECSTISEDIRLFSFVSRIGSHRCYVSLVRETDHMDTRCDLSLEYLSRCRTPGI